MERHEESVEERRLVTKLAQRRILEVYGLLLDLSNVDVASLQKFNKRKRLPNAWEDMTWARWSKELFGESGVANVLAAEHISGQTRLSTLRLRMERLDWLSNELLEREAVIMEQERTIAQLREDLDKRSQAPEEGADIGKEALVDWEFESEKLMKSTLARLGYSTSMTVIEMSADGITHSSYTRKAEPVGLTCQRKKWAISGTRQQIEELKREYLDLSGENKVGC